MSRWVGLLVLALALLQASGADALLADAACAREHHAVGAGLTCSDDGSSESECPDDCAACPCCARVSFTPLQVAVVLGQPVPDRRQARDGSTRDHEDPAPRGILHVPRAAA